MKKTAKTLALLAATAVLFAACSTKAEPIRKTDFVLGTVCTISIYDSKDKAEQAIEQSFRALKKLEQKLSANIPTSLISKINTQAHNTQIEMDTETTFIMQKALEYAEKSQGAFDPAIGALVKLWNIGTEEAKIPSKEEIQALLSSADYKNIKITDNRIKLINPDTRVDLGAIAKGYASDMVKNILTDNNVKKAIIDLGGNIYALGTRPTGEDWRIGIQDPRNNKGRYIAILKVSNKAVVTSGDYERFFIKNNRRYHHILDPSTGYPAESGIISVSIISPSGIDADALSTTAFVLGAKKGLDFIEKYHKDTEAIFITEDKKIITTKGLRGKLKLETEDYKLAE